MGLVFNGRCFECGRWCQSYEDSNNFKDLLNGRILCCDCKKRLFHTAYTIGHTKSYLQGLEEMREKFKKLGKIKKYPGGWVFKTKVEAKEFLKSKNFLEYFNKPKEFSVFSMFLKRGWDKDTYYSKMHKSQCLLKTSRILKKESVWFPFLGLI